MYTSERFLSYAGEFLGATVKPDAIDEIRAVGLQASERLDYKQKITTVHPIAIKWNQREVHAPDHEDWGTVACDTCGEKFALGYNRLYGPGGQTSVQCAETLGRILEADHASARPHANSIGFDFPAPPYDEDYGRISFPNYQFICPKCALPISVVWKGPKDKRKNVSFALDCPRASCGWHGELPASAGHAI